jgi:voltage-dependent calcium channel
MAFAAVFMIEALIKVIADGAFWTPNAYFRSLWGFIDALVLITLLINVITSFLNDGAVSRAVGAFKALRALRLLNVSDSARETFNKLIFVGGWRVLSVRLILSLICFCLRLLKYLQAAFVSISLLIPFAIYGVNLFNGQMAFCNDSASNITNLSDCAGEWGATPFNNNWSMVSPRVVTNPYFDFDNFGSALFILFQIVSQEGWVDVMWSAESIMGRGLQPQPYASQGNAIFFVIFNLMATVFVLTLFISVFMRTYTEQTGVAFLTTEQRSWMELRKLLKQVAPSKRPSNKANPKWKIWCYKRAVQKHGKWHQGVTVILVLHLILLMLEYYPEPYWWTRARTYIFLVFTAFYIANTFIRIVGLTWPRFRRSSWDMYSLVAVSGTFVTTLLLFSNFDSTTYNQFHKLFLVSITLLLIPRNNALDQLFKTAAASLANIGNLLATWFVLFLVYAIAMTQIFGLTKFGSQGTNNLNLRTVPKALVVLFRISCGEGWNQIMEDYASAQPPFCIDSGNFFESDCGSPGGARFLFISWNIISMYIFVSLFVSLIYESFSYVYQRSSGLSIVTREETRRFKQAWATFDPQGTGYISKENFPRLLGELSGVFAMRIYDEEDSVRRILEDVQVETPGMRASSVASASQATGIDLKKLNERISRIDAKKVRQRRHRYNLFYQEVMVSAEPDRGLSFTTVLMILAHYNVISDNKSLK